MTPTWQDASLWADFAEDSGIDCPICGVTLGSLPTRLGDAIHIVQEHMKSDHPETQGDAT